MPIWKILFISIMLAASYGAASADWRFRSDAGPGATYFEGGRMVGLRIECAGGEPSLVFFGEGWDLQPDMTYSVVALVDDTAFVLPSKVRRRGGERDLVHRADWKETAPLIQALMAGKNVEISTPLGRYTLPLKGSSAALKALRAACR
ncbi:hypothetical protein [Consotaella salsifontis]|uniref:Uncharacterized protein n=1 Tax=Consotaella salsifontis TaxID=1365950 RepID=A0A1T4RPZ6_9HYPH|nr:hypothetical protein [Consotaella salsifontis]SKA18095.1 hypothetical protein SAMN05428963_107167 [Consotaella salsifontis]